MTDNPYSTPLATLEPDLSRGATHQPDLRLANIKQRGVTFILDLVFGFMLLTLAKSILISLFESLGFVDAFLIAYYAITYFIYYLVFEWVWAYTPAKLVMGTRVVSKTGATASLPQLLIRTACRYIPFDFLSFLFVKSEPAFEPASKQASRPVGWHDQFSDTRVIDTRYI